MLLYLVLPRPHFQLDTTQETDQCTLHMLVLSVAQTEFRQETDPVQRVHAVLGILGMVLAVLHVQPTPTAPLAPQPAPPALRTRGRRRGLGAVLRILGTTT